MRNSLPTRKRIVPFLALLACTSAMAAVPPEENELFVWSTGQLQMIPTRPVVGIAAGGNTSFALQDDGQVAEWGTIYNAPSRGIRGATKIITGTFGIAALMGDGTVRSSIAPLDSIRRVMDIAGRNLYVSVLDSDHVARTFRHDGVRVDSVRGVKAVAITFDGNWYLRDDGVVLDGAHPRPELGVFQKLAGGGWHVAGLRADSTVKVWGSDTTHQQNSIPANLAGVVDIKAGWCHTTALRKDGTVASWGLSCTNAFACPVSMGDYSPSRLPCSSPDPRNSFRPPTNPGRVASIAAGDNHSLALLEDGRIVSWGDSMGGHCTPPEGRSQVANVEAEGNLLAVLHKDGTLSLGNLGRNTIEWTTNPPANAFDLREISASRFHVLGLDSSNVLRGWNSDGSPYDLPSETILLDRSVVPFSTEGIVAISANHHDAVQTRDGRLLVNNGENSWQEAAPESRGAQQILSANDGIYALKKDGTVLWMDPRNPTLTESRPWTKIQQLIGGGVWNMAAQDSSGKLFLEGSSLGEWQFYPSEFTEEGPLPPPKLTSIHLEKYGMVALEFGTVLFGWGTKYHGPFGFPAEAPRMSSVATGQYFAVGIIAPGQLYAKTAPKPHRTIPIQRLALGAYPARLFDPRGGLLWEGHAEWSESGWRIPSKHRGLAVLHARTPSGTRTERIFLAR